MTLCPNGQLAIIRWRYPGEAERETEGDNYDIKANSDFSGGQCEKTYLVRCLWDGRSKTLVRIRGKITSVTCRNYQAPDQVSRITYDIIAKNDKGETVEGRNITSPVPDGVSQTIEIQPVSGRDDCGNKVTDWTFKIFRDGQVIYEETRNVSPEVTYSCENPPGCPPDTCEVLCGDTICCYNSEGISVFNYPNT